VKITFVLPAYARAPVGGFKVVYEYANRLTRRGHRVTVLHRDPPGPPKSRAEAWKGNVRRIVIRRFERARPRWMHLDERVESRVIPDLESHRLPDADALVATAWQTARAVAQAPTRAGAGVYLVQGYEAWSGEAAVVDATWRLPLHKVVISRSLYDRAVELGEANHSTCIPNGMDLERFRVTLHPAAREPARVAMMFHEDRWKGSTEGLEALRKIRQRQPSLRAVLFGTPGRPTRFPAWIEYVRRPEPDALVALFNSCAVFLQPSWTEGWGLAATEAMACGCALVTTDNGGSRDYARDGSTALVTPPKDPAALARATLRLLEDDRLRLRIAEAGHKHVQRYCWERATDQLEQVLTATARERGVPKS
jgi:glycosyltransferase involved in cell wall biosynthesis